MTMHAKWMSHALTQGIRTNISPSTKSATADEYFKKVPRYKKVPSINYWYFAKRFKFFVVKLRLLRKSSDILLLGMTNTTLVLRFTKSNKLYYVQTAEVANVLVVKDVSC